MYLTYLLDPRSFTVTDSLGISPDSMCLIPRAEKSIVCDLVYYSLFFGICHELYQKDGK